ncbi:MAG: Ig-like domain-containing protein, partial [Pantoea sp.]|uniref:Ig-like domain-containing protein n=1 Tax=Pantoea sp. TaxID=69393 RepID=UPI0039E44714
GTSNDSANSQPVIGGKAEPGSTIIITDSEGNEIGSTVVNADGSWELTPNQPLPDGSNGLVITVKDPAGNSSTATDLPMNIGDGSSGGDNEAPTGTTTITAEDDDGKVINTENPTKDNTPTFKGQVTGAQADDYVVIKDGDTVLGTATINADGSWEFTVPEGEALQDDAHSITATVTDKDGNEGQPSAALEYTQDTVPPTGTTTIAAEDDDGKVINAENPTKDNTPTFSGQVTGAQADDYVVIKDGDKVLGTATINADGSWEFTVPEGEELQDDGHSITATVTDKAGNEGQPSAALDYTQDTAPPTATTTIAAEDNDGKVINAENPTKDSTPTFKGQVTGAQADDYVVIKDGDKVLGTATINADGSWEFTVPEGEELQDDGHSITATVTDKAGNEGQPSTALEYTQDTVPPTSTTTLTIEDNDGNVIDAEHPTKDNTPTFKGQLTPPEKGAIVIIKDGETVLGSVVANDDGTWEFTVPAGKELAEKDHSITATITDAAGNEGTTTDPVNYDQDNTNPEPATDVKVTNDQTDTDVGAGGLTNDNTPTLSGKAEAGCTVYIYDKDGNAIASVVTEADGSWRIQLPTVLTDGLYNEMTVQVVDQAGNASTSTPVPDFTVDTLNTNKTTIETDAEAAESTPTFKGQVELGTEDTDFANMTITIYDRNGLVIATGIPVNADGSWEYTVPDDEALGSGAHNISAVVVDAANNESQPGYLNGTEDGGWTIPAVLYSDAGGGEGDMFGYAMVVSGEYIYISAPNGGTNAAGQPTNQGIIYAVKKEFSSLLDGSTSIEKLFAANPGMGTIISNNGDAKGDGQPDVNSYQGYGMKALDGGWVAIYMHEKDTVYFVKESLLTDNNFDLSLISNAENGKSQYGFMMTLANGLDSWFGFNANSMVNKDGTLTFMIGDIHGAREQTGNITTVTFNPNGTNPDGNWANMHLIRDPNDTTDNAAWVPQETLPDGMVIGKIGHENTNGTVGSTQSYNFGTDIVYMGDVFGNGSNYVAFMDAASAHTGESYRGSWYFYKIPDTGLPNDFSIGDVADEDLIVIDNIGAGYLNLIANDVLGDFGSDEYKPIGHNIAMLGHFGSGEHTDIAIASAGDSQGGANGKVWILHSDKITDDMTIGVNTDNPKFNTDVGYAIVSKVQAGRGDKGEGFGLNVIGGYDMNRDGTQDLIISDPLAMKDGKCVGAVYIVYGGHQADYLQYLASLGADATGEIDIQVILNNGWGEVHYGSVDNQRFGWSVEVVDMNNDGAPDMLVGAPSQLGTDATNTEGEATNPQYNGQVYVVYNTHSAPAEDAAPSSRSYSLPADEQNHDDGGIPLLLDGEHQNVDLAALTESLKDTHSIDMTDGNNTLKVNNQTLDSWEGADGDALIVSGENGLVQLTGGIENWHSNGTVTVDGKVYTEYQSSGMAEVLIEDRIHVNIL